MANTFELISSVTVGSGGASSITLNSIPSTFTDLCLKLSSRFDAVANTIYVSYNGSSSNFSWRNVYGLGTGTPGSQNGTSNLGLIGQQSVYTANTFGNAELYIPNYAGSNYKSYASESVQENNGSQAYAFMIAGLWSNTAAINQITLTPDAANFVQYSTAYLYGIKSS